MYILVRGFGGLINGEAYFQGTYMTNLNRMSALKQAIALLIKIHFTFTGL